MQTKPEVFSSDGSKDIRVKHLKDFENLCSMIEDNSSSKAKTLSLYEFLSRIEYIKKKKEFEAKQGVRL